MKTPENTLNDDQFSLMDCKKHKNMQRKLGSALKAYVIESKATRAKAEKAVVYFDGHTV